MKNIIFMGSDKIAIPLLDYLLTQGNSRFQLVGVVSQPDRPQGRGRKIQANPISSWALDHEIDLQRPEKPDEALYQWMLTKKVDLILVMAYGHILRENFLKLPPLGMLNFHGSILPQYRGASPIEAAIANGEQETGITLMEMVKKMDAGGMLDIEKCSISPDDNAATLREKMSFLCVPLISRNIEDILAAKINFQPQDESLVTFTRKITKLDSWLDFNQKSQVLHNRIRAIGGYFKFNQVDLKIGHSEYLSGTASPGVVVNSDRNGLLIGTSEGLLKITHLQRPGGKMLAIGDFLRGFPIEIASLCQGNPEGNMPLESKEPFKFRH